MAKQCKPWMFSPAEKPTASLSGTVKDEVDTKANLEVRRHDITADALEPDTFDLILARKVLEHLPQPTMALARMYNGLRPGGWLYVEDTDMASFRRLSCPRPELFERVYSRFLEVMSAAGFQPTLGIRLGDELRAVGLEAIQFKGLMYEWTGGGDNPAGKVYIMTVQRLRKSPNHWV